MVEGKSESNKIELPGNLTVGDLATKLNLDSVDVIKQLMRAGYMLSINQKIEYELASLISKSFGFTPLEIKDYSDATQFLKSQAQGDEIKPPVVTILGHVDHGKTTLLDKIRQTAVAESEFGGITQKLSAYKLKYKDSFITFLDTPGHEAFSTLRSRGAKVTDIAIIIIAADDGIMPQTEESIKHAQAAGVPMIIAISKIDLPNADVEKVKSQLAERDMLIEEWGGDIISVSISALNGDGVPELESLFLKHLPDGEPLYPDDYLTDQPERVFVSETVREKLLQHTYDEIPFSSAVIVDRFQESDERGVIRLYCSIIVEQASQKPIVLGRGGSMIKRIGTEARLDLERFFDAKVYLDLHVKIRAEWRENDRLLDDLGVQGPRD